jgi:hypothetical protein
MPTLSASNSLFELAFGVNAVLPVLISDFERIKEQAAESLLRKLKECRPHFELKERDRVDFVDFAFRSNVGLRHAHWATRIVSVLSIVFCIASLGALVWSAHSPDQQVDFRCLVAFVAVTLVFAPSLYVARDRYLKWLYSILVVHGSNEKADAELFANCVEIYLTYMKRFEQHDRAFAEVMAQAPILIWKARLILFQIRVMRAWNKLRSKLSFKRSR